MTVVILRPAATQGSPGDPPVTGAADIATALSDNSDASYVVFAPNVQTTQNLGDASLPAGATVKTGAVRARLIDGDPASFGGTSSIDVYVSALGGPTAGGRTAPPQSIVTMSIESGVAGWTAAQINGATMALTGVSGSVTAYEAYFDVTYVAKPVVAVNAPTGTVTNTNRPLVSWTNTLDADGGAQTRATVKIFSDAQYTAGGFNPATSAAVGSEVVTGSATSHTLAAVLPDGTYRAYVQVAQTVNGAEHSSAYAFSGFSVSVALPAAPTITVTAEATAGRNKIDVTSNAGTATTDELDLERSLDAGTTWVPVRHTGGLVARIAATSATVYDYEAMNGSAVLYRARALHNYSGQYAASAWVQASGTWTSTAWWLKHPLRPALNAPIELVTYGPITRAARQGSFQPLGASLPIVVADTRLGAAGMSTVRTRNTAERDLLEAVAAVPATLLLQGPAAAGEPDRYIRVGDLVATRLVENINIAARTFTLPWAEVAQPDGAQTGSQYTPPPELVLDGGMASTTVFESVVDGGAA